MSTVFGLTSLDLRPQPDFSATLNENGGWAASQSVVSYASDFDSFAFRQKLVIGTTKATDIDTSIPSFFSFLRLIGVDFDGTEGSVTTLRLRYSGTPANDGTGDGASVKTYTLNGVLQNKSIMEHPKVAALTSLERSLLNAILEKTAYWDVTFEKIGRWEEDTGEFVDWAQQDITSDDGKTFAEKIALGFISYESPSFTWTEYLERNTGLTGTELADIGTVSTPNGTPPNWGGDYDWLLVSATQDFDGSKYRITRQWQLSDSSGWDSDIYST
jgi:hypothetical protein